MGNPAAPATGGEKAEAPQVVEKSPGSPVLPSATKPFLITRLLRRSLPQSWTERCARPGDAKPRGTPLVRGLLEICFSNRFRVVRAAAFGHELAVGDLVPLPEQQDLAIQANNLHAALLRFATGEGSPTRHPLLLALWHTQRARLIVGLLCLAAFYIIDICQLLLFLPLTRFLIPYYRGESQKQKPLGYGVGLLAASTMAILVSRLARNRGVYSLSVAGGILRAALISNLTTKACSISILAGRAQGPDAQGMSADSCWTSGAMLNLVNTDAQRVEQALQKLLHSCALPVVVLLVGGLSYWLIGWPGWVAMALLLLIHVPIPFFIRQINAGRKRINLTSDARVSKVTDCLSGIRLLKLYAWEDVFAAVIQKIRAREGRLLKLQNARLAFMQQFAAWGARSPALLAVGLYALSHRITVDTSPQILVIVAFYTQLNGHIRHGPTSIVSLIDAYQSVQRMQSFLLAEDFEEQPLFTLNPPPVDDQITGESMSMRAARFIWARPTDDGQEVDSDRSTTTSEDEKPQATSEKDSRQGLQAMTLSIKDNELLAIVGPSSAGKSAFAAGMAGILPLASGSVGRASLPTYCSTNPWLRAATIRDNVLFGLPFNEVLYWRAVSACQLLPDIEALGNRDLTLLGEKGVLLSGGTKMRVNIARSVYDALFRCASSTTRTRESTHLVILDDPFSALDTKTSAAAFDAILMQELRPMTRVLVTHQIHFMQRCDRIVFMEDCGIAAIGSFEELSKTVPSFTSFVKGHLLSPASEDGNASKTHTATQEDHSPSEHAMVMVEDQHSDSVSWHTYARYINWPRPVLMLVMLAFAFVVSQVALIAYSLAFAWWASSAKTYALTDAQWSAIILSIAVMQIIWWCVTFIGTGNLMVSASVRLHDRALKGLFKVNMRYLDSTPLGRIMTRFTQDVNYNDSVLPEATWGYFMGTFNILVILGAAIYYIPLVAAVFAGWLLIAVFFVLFCRPAPLVAKRLEALQASNLMSHVTETISGVEALRTAPAAKAYLLGEIPRLGNLLNRVHVETFAIQAGITTHADMLSCVLYFCVGLLGLRLRHSIIPGVLVTLLTQSLALLTLCNWLLECQADVQRGLNCVERLQFYDEGISDRWERHDMGLSNDTSTSWRPCGHIEFQQVQARYRDELPLAIRGLHLEIQPGEKIGVVGRTGAGKSSIFALLLAVIDPCAGRILVDGQDISKLSVTKIRRAITILPQEPSLFEGTVRTNLDPSGELPDERLLEVLNQTGLQYADWGMAGHDKHHSADDKDSTPEGSLSHTDHTAVLSAPISVGGANLSSGRRQLLSLARALIRDTKIILIDEATSNVDYESDRRIQDMLRESLADRTVLTIAHRINTVLGYDRIVVVDAGTVREVGTPRELWGRRDGAFRALCDQGGIGEEHFT